MMTFFRYLIWVPLSIQLSLLWPAVSAIANTRIVIDKDYLTKEHKIPLSSSDKKTKTHIFNLYLEQGAVLMFETRSTKLDQSFTLNSDSGQSISIPNQANGAYYLGLHYIPKGQYQAKLVSSCYKICLDEINFQVSVLDKTLRWTLGNHLKEGLIYGTAIAMLIYNLCMFIMFRKLYFLTYCLYIGSAGGILSLVSLQLQVPFDPTITFYALFVTGHLAISAFAIQYYKGTKYGTPLILLQAITFSISCFINISFILGLKHDDSFASVLQIINLLPIFCYSIVRAVKGSKPALFMSLGWTCLIIGWIMSIYAYFVSYNEFLAWGAWMGFSLEAILFSISALFRLREQESRLQKSNLHAYSELKKICYPHQIQMIKNYSNIEDTMPTHSAQAITLCFDIIESSQINPQQRKEFIRCCFKRCYQIMLENYCVQEMTSRAYRIKELGDGFLCSLGYPFKSTASNIETEAINLAKDFHKIMMEEAEKLQIDPNPRCGIGIAFGNIQGFYPDAGTKEYDLHGDALILATRYESFRKLYFEKSPKTSVLFIQKKIYEGLCPQDQSLFQEIHLCDQTLQVRDDPHAKTTYLMYLNKSEQSEAFYEHRA